MAKRLKQGEFQKMTPEQQAKHRKMLAKRYRLNHKELIKQRNRRFYDLYREIKPYRPHCTICGNVFAAPRPYAKQCPHCRAKIRATLSKRQLEVAQAIENRRIRDERKREVYRMWKAGMTQKEIAELYGVSQANVSYWIRTRKRA